MSWCVVVRPEAEQDLAEAGGWYNERLQGLGDEFVVEVTRVFDALAINPFLNSRRYRLKNIRWRYPERFSLSRDL